MKIEPNLANEENTKRGCKNLNVFVRKVQEMNFISQKIWKHDHELHIKHIEALLFEKNRNDLNAIRSNQTHTRLNCYLDAFSEVSNDAETVFFSWFVLVLDLSSIDLDCSINAMLKVQAQMKWTLRQFLVTLVQCGID